MANVELAVEARTGLDRQLPLLLVLVLVLWMELMWPVCMLWDRMTGGVDERSDAEEDEPANEGGLPPEGGGASEQLMVLTLAWYPCCG